MRLLLFFGANVVSVGIDFYAVVALFSFWSIWLPLRGILLVGGRSTLFSLRLLLSVVCFLFVRLMAVHCTQLGLRLYFYLFP